MSARVEDAAPQPAGGGVAPCIPVMNAEEPQDAKPNDRTIHETRVRRVTASGECTLDNKHPMVPVLLNQTGPAAVIIPPLNCFPDFRPVVRFKPPQGSSLTSSSD